MNLLLFVLGQMMNFIHSKNEKILKKSLPAEFRDESRMQSLNPIKLCMYPLLSDFISVSLLPILAVCVWYPFCCYWMRVCPWHAPKGQLHNALPPFHRGWFDGTAISTLRTDCGRSHVGWQISTNSFPTNIASQGRREKWGKGGGGELSTPKGANNRSQADPQSFTESQLSLKAGPQVWTQPQEWLYVTMLQLDN